MKKITLSFCTVLTAVIFSSCSKDEVKQTTSIEGTWELIFPIEQYQPLSIQCTGNGDFTTEEYKINNGQLIISQNNVTVTEKHTIKNNNITIEFCKIITDLPDTTSEKTLENSFTYDENFFYIRKDNVEPVKVSYTVTGGNKIEITDADYKYIYIKK